MVLIPYKYSTCACLQFEKFLHAVSQILFKKISVLTNIQSLLKFPVTEFHNILYTNILKTKMNFTIMHKSEKCYN